MHGGWLIFKLPPAELGIHPAGDSSPSGRHQLYLMCDDIETQVAELKAKGVDFTSPIEDQSFGVVTTLRVPGGGEICLYKPKHAVAYDLQPPSRIKGRPRESVQQLRIEPARELRSAVTSPGMPGRHRGDEPETARRRRRAPRQTTVCPMRRWVRTGDP